MADIRYDILKAFLMHKIKRTFFMHKVIDQAHNKARRVVINIILFINHPLH
jgi:hypothetical protein